MRIVGVIPCRYSSTRFPGKPLAEINGKPMMWHVYQKCKETNIIDDIYIATDDDRISDAAKKLKLNVVMTRNDHATGTDRVAEVATKIDSDYYINIQGDEPLINPDAIASVINGLVECDDPMVVASNAYAPVCDPSDVVNSNVVKVIMTVDGDALAYSRQPIPYPKSGKASYNKQLGIYAFRKKGLQLFAKNTPSYIELTEGVEMYRLIEHGFRVRMIETDDISLSVDTENDLLRAISMINK